MGELKNICYLYTRKHTYSMKREVYVSQKPFAGEKKPSMLRCCVGHDYGERMMYMLTMVTEGRRPLFGNVLAIVLCIAT